MGRRARLGQRRGQEQARHGLCARGLKAENLFTAWYRVVDEVKEFLVASRWGAGQRRGCAEGGRVLAKGGVGG